MLVSFTIVIVSNNYGNSIIDGQKIAKRLSNQITKENKHLHQLINNWCLSEGVEEHPSFLTVTNMESSFWKGGQPHHFKTGISTQKKTRDGTKSLSSYSK